MEKVVSFRVSDQVYDMLKHIMETTDQSFRDIFEPIALDVVQKNDDKARYTYGIRKNSKSLYRDLRLIQKMIQNVIKSYSNAKEDEERD